MVICMMLKVDLTLWIYPSKSLNWFSNVKHGPHYLRNFRLFLPFQWWHVDQRRKGIFQGVYFSFAEPTSTWIIVNQWGVVGQTRSNYQICDNNMVARCYYKIWNVILKSTCIQIWMLRFTNDECSIYVILYEFGASTCTSAYVKPLLP